VSQILLSIAAALSLAPWACAPQLEVSHELWSVGLLRNNCRTWLDMKRGSYLAKAYNIVFTLMPFSGFPTAAARPTEQT
jgi:hypothetical protein